MAESEIIVSGPPYAGEEFSGSVAEYIVPRMKARPKDHVCQMDSETDESITTGEFLKMSLEIAEGLVELGLKEGDVVVHACHNHIRSHVAAAGILFSGGVFSPFDTNMKPLEAQGLFKVFRPKFVICESDKGTLFRSAAKAVGLDPKVIVTSHPLGPEFLTWDETRAKVDVENYTPRKVADPKKAIALIACTSGSTGLPKGVALSHHAILLNHFVVESLKLEGSQENILMTSPLFWLSGSILLIGSCITGQTRYVPKNISSEGLLEGIQKYKPFFLLLSPSVLLGLVDHPHFKNYDTSSVKVIISSGAALGSGIIEKVTARWMGVVIFQMYGLTEVCGGVTTVASLDDPLTVGKLMPGTKMKVVDPATGKSVGPNVVGECRLKTNKLMVGYYNNEEDTKSTFDEDGWFLTGDLVYYTENGLIYTVARIKETIKYTNYQVPPAELEAFIIGLPGVKDVAVVPIPHKTDGNHVRALVVKDANSAITADFIIDIVKETFSNHKHLRGGVQFVDSLPRSEVGKLKRVEARKMIVLD